MHPLRPFPALLLLAAAGCAADAGAQVAPSVAASAAAQSPGLHLIVEATVVGTALAPTPDFAYYFVLDTNANPEDGPRFNGGAPLTYPYPDPRSYLPFARDEDQILDRQPIPVPQSAWTHYWALVMEGGQAAVYLGQPDANGVVNERARRLTRGTEWDVVGGNTWKLTIPVASLGAGTPLSGTWSANLATASRSPQVAPSTGLIDRWGLIQDQHVAIAPRLGEQAFYDPHVGTTNPAALGPGLNPTDFDFHQLKLRLVDVGAPYRLKS